MYPVDLQLQHLRILLAGKGPAFTRRAEALRAAGAEHITLHEGTMPAGQEISEHHLLLVAGLDETESAALAGQARALRVPVNVEDKPTLCDYYFMSHLRRGQLLLAVSTSGASPVLGQELRGWLAEQFGEEWAGRTAQIGALREEWRREGCDMQTLAARTREYIRSRKWLAATQQGEDA